MAIKFLAPELTRSAEAKRRFVQEARAASALDHPNVAVVHEIAELETGEMFIVMAFYPGVTLKERSARGVTSIAEALDVAIQIAEGLRRAHEQGIVHRDVKPANVMILEDGPLKILDFGLAKVHDVTLTQSSRALGTAAYMSPEQVRGGAVDHLTDLWSLGVVLFELLCGRRPFEAENALAVVYAIRYDDPPRLETHRPDAPKRLAEVVGRLLSKDPNERHQSTQELLADLRSIREEIDGRATVSHTATGLRPEGEPRREKLRRSPTFEIAAAVVLVLLLVGLYVTRLHDTSRRAPLESASVAVLPLVNLTGDERREFFSDGMTDAVINELGTVASLNVISWTSSMRFKQTDRTLPEIARELNVRHLVEGTVLTDGDRVRISIRLIAADTDQQLWGDSYERFLEDVISLQREVARTIAREIGIRLTPQQEHRMRAAAPANPAAYTAYLQGMYAWNCRPPVGPAIEFFERAIELDPTFAPAYAMLGGSYSVGGDVAHPREEIRRRALEAITRAIALDEDNAEAYNMRGWVRVYFDYDWEGAGADFQRAITLNASYADAYHRYAHYLMVIGRPQEALEASRRARELSPLDRVIAGHHVWDLYMTREYERAVEYSERILEADPSNFYAFQYAIPAYEQLGRFEWILEAEDVTWTDRTRALALSGRTADARRRLDDARLLDGGPSSISMALVHAALGDVDEALEWLEEAYRERAYPLPNVAVDPRFDALRDAAAFAALLERLGLAASRATR